MVFLRGGRLVALLLILVAAASVPPTAHAQAPACPSLTVALSAKRIVRGPGRRFGVRIKVRNTGVTALQDVGLRVTVPMTVTYLKVAALPRTNGDFAATRPVFKAPQVYWPNFLLDAGKARIFLLRGKVSKCQAAGTFTIEASAYQLSANCSTLAVKPTQVRTYVRQKGSLDCRFG